MKALYASVFAGLLCPDIAAAQAQCPYWVVFTEPGVRIDFAVPDAALRQTLATWEAQRPEGAAFLQIDRTLGHVEWAPPSMTGDDLAVLSAAQEAAYNGPRRCMPNLSALQVVYKGGDNTTVPASEPPAAPTPAPSQSMLPVTAEVPKSGAWRVSADPAITTGCPAMIAENIAASDPFGTKAADATRQFDFSSGFNPAALGIDGIPGARWAQQADGAWVADFVEQIPDAPGQSTHVILRTVPQTPELIIVDMDITIKLPLMAQAMLGVGPKGCQITRKGRWQWVG